jgi:UDP-2,3-diacylglucosamine hydrolase
VTTLFISDLHLESGRLEIIRLFLDFLTGEARRAESLYILGDLFELWVGDDAATPLALQVSDALATLNSAGVAVYFMHGNRDLLLGDAYAQKAGMKLLPEPLLLDLYGSPTLLLHGDSLCLDDIEYQQFRATVRDPLWQENFLSGTIAERLEFAAQVRDASQAHTGSSPMEIMDVTAQAVDQIMLEYGVKRLIHGHTHRPAIHGLSLAGQAAERIVLGDWYRTGSVLRIDHDHVELAELPLTA